MAVTIRHAPVIASGRAVSAIRTSRKVAIFGTHQPSLVDAPWTDDSWERWGHATGRNWYSRQMDLYFDLHPKACWTRGGKKGHDYPLWLKRQTTPIYMQQRYSEVPASMEYPKRRILQEFGGARPYFTNHVAWMLALAFTENVTTIGLFGINYAIQSEYLMQRASCEYWIGRAQERGIHVILPEQCTLLREPGLLYGYESHDEETGIIKREYKVKEWTRAETIEPGPPPPELRAKPTPEILEQIKQEEAEYPRPEWALGPLPDKGNGKPVEGNA